jgi:hypothetical protein
MSLLGKLLGIGGLLIVIGAPAPIVANTADDDFRYGKAIASYVMGGYSMDWLKQSRCSYLVQPRQYMNEAISEVEQGIPARLRAEVKSHLSGASLAKMQQEAKGTLGTFLAEAIKKKGERVGCESIEAMVKITYTKARHDWNAYVTQMRNDPK